MNLTSLSLATNFRHEAGDTKHMKTIRIEMTLQEEALGTASANPDIHREFIASKAPDAKTVEEEVAAVGVEEFIEKSMTVFPRCKRHETNADHLGDPDELVPFLYDYQIKGFFKDSCGALARVPDTRSNKLKAYKKIIDGTIFVFPRKIALVLPEGQKIGVCSRPLRAETAQGPRVALASSESIPAGTKFQFDIKLLDGGHEALVMEWLEYAALRGIGQWRNSGKGRATFRVLKT